LSTYDLLILLSTYDLLILLSTSQEKYDVFHTLHVVKLSLDEK